MIRIRLLLDVAEVDAGRTSDSASMCGGAERSGAAMIQAEGASDT